jgi:hypothetical protein
VFPYVEKNVNQSIAHFAGRAQFPRVEPSAQDGSAATEHAVVCPRKANGEPGHSPREGRTVVRLDNEMGVVVLHAEMHDAEPRPCRRGECSPQLTEASLFAHTGQKPPATQRHMNRMAATMEGALCMRHILSSRGVSPLLPNGKRKA